MADIIPKMSEFEAQPLSDSQALSVGQGWPSGRRGLQIWSSSQKWPCAHWASVVQEVGQVEPPVQTKRHA